MYETDIIYHECRILPEGGYSWKEDYLFLYCCRGEGRG